MITEFFDNKEFTKKPVKEKPKLGQRVLLLCAANWGGNYITVAEYIPHMTVPEEDFMAEEFWGEGDYCEKDDTYYTPEGWYESSFVSDYNWKITDKIIMWEPLPVITDNNFKIQNKMKRDVRIIWSDQVHPSAGLIMGEDILQRAVKFVEDDERIVNIELIAEGVTSRFWIYVEKIEIGGKNM